MNYEDDIDFEKLTTQALKEILRHEDFPTFLSWMTDHLGKATHIPASAPPPEYLKPMAMGLALPIWNGTPLPGNGFKPRSIPRPKRNALCLCGSGKKFKKCCFSRDQHLLDIDSEMIWPLLFELLPAKTLEDSLQDNTLPLSARIFYCAECLDEGNSDKVIQLLADYYLAPSYSSTDEQTGYGLSLLLDAYDMEWQQEKKMALIEHVCSTAPSSPLRSDALQRLATIQADAHDLQAAFRTLKKARKDTPDDPGVGLLEIQLLLLKGDFLLAKQRARFISKQIHRQEKLLEGSIAENPMLDFIEQVMEDPENAAATMYEGGPPDNSTLSKWLEENSNRPLTPIPIDRDDNLAQVMGPSPASKRPHFIVCPTPAMRKLEARWFSLCPIEPLFGVQIMHTSNEEPWKDAEGSSWQSFLLEHPESLDSIMILDDLLSMLPLHPGWGEPQLMLSVFQPILERAVALVNTSLQQLPADACLPWLATENRPFLRVLVRLMLDHSFADELDESELVMEQILLLNPADNHGFRGALINSYLRSGDNDKALELAADFTEDIIPAVGYGRVLALYRLERKKEALRAARAAKKSFPQVASYLTASQRKDPGEDNPFGNIAGGKAEAWEYRQEMRETWKTSRGILTWLKKVK